MAVRMRLSHQQDVRNKIRASQLVNFLQSYALTGKCFDGFGRNTKPDEKHINHRVRAATALLAKILPDLNTMTLQDQDGNAVVQKTTFEERATRLLQVLALAQAQGTIPRLGVTIDGKSAQVVTIKSSKDGP